MIMSGEEKIYFGHAIDIYDTDLEEELVRHIETQFPQYAVETPNQERHKERYKAWKLANCNGMQYFCNEVLPKMRAGVFLPFCNGKFGAGVYSEAKSLSDRGRPIYEIDLEGKISAMELDDSRALTVEETRERVYKSSWSQPFSLK